MSSFHRVARGLATAFLCGAWNANAMAGRARQVLGKGKWKSVDGVVERVRSEFGERPPKLEPLTDFIAADAGFRRSLARDRSGKPREINLLALPRPEMTPAPGFPDVAELPAIVTAGELGDWLHLRPSELDWFADLRGLERQRPAKAQHYRYRWIKRKSGRRRLLEIPKSRLKAIQRTLLHEILGRIPGHDAAHAFRRGRSVKTFAAPHAGRRIVLRIDLRNFFPSISRGRIDALFRTIGYPEAVAQLLAGLCTNVVPDDVLFATNALSDQDRRVRRDFARAHLPQGAPTSPALANLVAYRLDCRLTGLAEKTNARYTRYADDLVFSGGNELARMLPHFRVLANAIVLNEGFAIRDRKTQVMGWGTRQQVAGVVLNEHVNFSRREFDRLRAMLHNCIQHGPMSQNRAGVPRFREHLLGRIGYFSMLNSDKATRLQRLFERIYWDEHETTGTVGG